MMTDVRSLFHPGSDPRLGIEDAIGESEPVLDGCLGIPTEQH